MNDTRSAEALGLRLRSHSVHLDNRELLSVTGVRDVGCFNDREVMLTTDAGAMTVEGEGLHITKLDLDDGQVMIEGDVSAVIYEDEPPEKRESFLKRMFR